MEQIKEPADLNPWHERKDFPGVRETNLIPATVLLALSCLSLSLSAEPIVPWILGVILALGALYLTRKRFFGTVLLFAVAGFLLPETAWGASVGLLLLAMTAGIFLTAYLLTVTGRPYLSLIVSALMFAASWIVTRSPATASLSFLPVLPGLLLGLATLLQERRTVAVAYGIVGCLVPLTGVVIWYLSTTGGLSSEHLQALIGGWKEQTYATWTEQAEVMLKAVRMTVTNSTQLSALDQMLGEETIRTYVNSVFNLMPALILIVCEFCAFFGQKMLTSAYLSNNLKRVVGLENEFFGVGLVTALVWAFSLVMSFFGTPTSNLFFAVTENIRYFLLAPLCIVGVRAFLLTFFRRRGGPSPFFGVLWLALLCCSPDSALSLLALFGVYETIGSAVKRAIDRKKQYPGGGTNPPGGYDDDDNDGND